MMKHVFKKSMAVAGVLACLFTSAAFAQTVTTTPEQDKATQEAALQENKAYDASHGLKNESAAEAKVEKEIEKEKKEAEDKNKAVEQDKATQAEAVKENKDYDASHGYTNGAPAAPAAAKEEVKATADESWKEAVEKDKQTQADALKANREYDEAHGYKK
ncbi:MAG: hypothetical protein SPL86_10070 [Succiniclasticum sp.]|uniref:hypothetical protein n=1 Tax=Succiniclasticum sp. TaxID=2775030 RepID=UPI002A917A30|nr:hypothetical protein [Succiniclasticum sp.]MDY6291817.1 hypothetical protein [Succiniclasticum sp.]